MNSGAHENFTAWRTAKYPGQETDDTLFGVIIGTIPNKKNAFWGPFFAHIFRHYQGKIKAI